MDQTLIVVIKQVNYVTVQITAPTIRDIIFEANDLDITNLDQYPNVVVINPITTIETYPVQYTDINGNVIYPELL